MISDKDLLEVLNVNALFKKLGYTETTCRNIPQARSFKRYVKEGYSISQALEKALK